MLPVPVPVVYWRLKIVNLCLEGKGCDMFRLMWFLLLCEVQLAKLMIRSGEFAGMLSASFKHLCCEFLMSFLCRKYSNSF